MALNIFNRQQAGEMSFIDHLEALRWHILRSVIAVLIFAVVIFINIDWVFNYVIAGPINPKFISYKALCSFSHWAHLGETLCLPPVDVKLQTTTFGGQFMSSISIAFIGGFFVAFPYIFWEFWRFVKPALKPKELKGTRFVIFWVSFFFFLGGSFGYFILGPFTFNFLAGFNISSQHLLETRPTLADYLDNLTNIMIGCGLAFELPVISYALTKIGIVTPAFLKKSRKFAIVVILVVAAVITPSPDWISQLLVFTPLFLLYQLSIVVSKKVYKDVQKRELEEWS
jgi:sec-independent protein translocase protein TatC